MNSRNIFSLLAIFSLILVLSISVVSASDANDTLGIDDSNNELSSQNVYYISPDGTGDGSSESNPSNWESVYEKANSGDKIIFLNGTYTSIKSNGGESKHSYGLDTTVYGLELVGSGNSTLDAQGAGGFFTTSGNVKLTNLRFINAYTGDSIKSERDPAVTYGGEGAVINKGTLEVRNCYFASNKGTGTEGGAIHNDEGATCYIYDSKFEGNGAKKGGSIYADKNSYVYVYDSEFLKGVCKEGTVFNAKEAYVEMRGCKVLSTSAKSGAIYIKKSTVKLYDTLFKDCSAVDTAAVINVEKESNVYVQNCTFDNLKAKGTKLWYHNENGTGNGGAINIEGGRITIKDSSFTNCSSVNDGGAIHIESSSSVTLDNCTFKDNTAGGSGNNIYGYPSLITIQNSLIEIKSTIAVDDIDYGQTANVKVTMDDGTNYNSYISVSLLIDGKDSGYQVGKSSSINLNDLSYGNHTVSLAASDNSGNTYVFSQQSATFTVGGETSRIVNVEYTYGDDGSINAVISDENGKAVGGVNVKLTINNTEFISKTNANGIATFKPTGLDVGEYEANIEVSGKVVSTTSPTKVKVINTTGVVKSNVAEVKYTYGEDGSVNIVVSDENGLLVSDAKVELTINGEVYTATTNENGIATIKPTNVVVGEYSVSVKVEGMDVSSNTPQTIKILPANDVSSIIAEDMKRAYNSAYDFKARLFDKNGDPLKNKKVTLILNGNDYEITTDENGYAIFKNELIAGNYKITIQNPSTLEETTKNITIVERITGNKNINMDYSYSATYKVRVFSDDGNPAKANEKVVFKIDGKIVKTALTDANGYATLTIKDNKLLAKTHTVTAEYKGSKVSNKLFVKQILKSQNKKYKRYKVKKFTATLKTSSGKAIVGKKVTFKIKGKTYTAKTNKKGVATIKIKGLYKLGKHTITISYLKTSIKKTVTVKR